MKRRDFIKKSSEVVLVTSTFKVISTLTACEDSPTGSKYSDGYYDGYYTDGYYWDGYYDGYYTDGYYFDGYSTENMYRMSSGES